MTKTLSSGLLFILILLTGCHEKKPAPSRPPAEVTTIIAEPRDVPAVFEFVGFTQSSHWVEVRARVEGYLDKIAYKEGTLVDEGQLLFQIDPRPFEASLEQAKSILLQNQALLWNAKKTAERYKVLYEQKAASERDLDNAIANQMSLEAQVVSATAGVESAALNLSFTTIKSPIKGLAAKSIFREGDLISPGPNSLLTSLQAIDPIWVYFSVSENELLKYYDMEKKGQIKLPADKKYQVQLILADGSVYPHLGSVDFTQPYFDQKTGTMLVRGVLPNPQNRLLPGQFVRVHLLGAIYPDTITVPQEAVMQGKNGMYVFIVSDGKAHFQDVETGDWVDHEWIILQGLLKGDEVIVEGSNKVLNDSPVIIKQNGAQPQKPAQAPKTKPEKKAKVK